MDRAPSLPFTATDARQLTRGSPSCPRHAAPVMAQTRARATASARDRPDVLTTGRAGTDSCADPTVSCGFQSSPFNGNISDQQGLRMTKSR